MSTDLCLLTVESSYPDLVINVGKVTLGEKNRNNLDKIQREKEKTKVAQAACALLNSGGGVIRMEMTNEDHHLVELGLDLEEILRKLIDSSDLQTFFESQQQERYYFIFVKSWSSDHEDSSTNPRICSLNSSLLCRSGTSVLCMDSREAFRFLKTKKRNARYSQENEGPLPRKIPKTVTPNSEPHPDKAFQKDRFEFGEILPFPESQFTEFKQFSTKNIQKYLKDQVLGYIPAFANSGGGYIFIGVDDQSKTVIGCSKALVDRNSLEDVLKKAISKLPVIHFCSSQPPVAYEIKIADVFQMEKLYGYLCMIKVEPFCCAVFLKDPSSWVVKDKKVSNLTTGEWVGMLMDTDSELAKTFEYQLNISHRPPSCKPVYYKKGLEHKEALQQHLFSVSEGHLQYTPKSLWEELSSQHEGLEELINKQMHAFSTGIFIFSRSWAMDLDLPEHPGVVCDALLIAQNSCPILYTILGKQDAYGQLCCYNTALTLKQKLVNLGGYTGKLCVMTKVLHLNSESSADSTTSSSALIDYPVSYKLADTHEMEALLQSLVIVLLGFRSFLSDQLGCEIFNLLTAQQYKIFSENLHKNRELFIHGLPGSGKTIMAIKIMEKIRSIFHCEINKILYVCENQPLKSFISNRNICQAVTRKAFMKGNFEDAQHIIIDEAQNFRYEDGDWYEKAKSITQRDKNCPGFFWIFLDYFQTSHLDYSGLPDFSSQNSRELLTRVVRNADPIANYLQKVMQKVKENPPCNIPSRSLEMLHKAEWAQGVQGTFKFENNLTKQEIITYVANTCRMHFEKGYSPKDIAVLVSTMSDMDVYRFELHRALRKKKVMQLTDASDMSGDHIVLDSIRRFSGLERSIVFGINPMVAEPLVYYSLLLCLTSRAKKHLYILQLSNQPKKM